MRPAVLGGGDAASDSSADFFRREPIVSLCVTADSDVNQGGFPRDFRQQTERCYRVCRNRLCWRDRARRVLGPAQREFTAPGGWKIPAAGRFFARSPRIAHDALAGVAAADVGELAFEGRGGRPAVAPFHLVGSA